jgi:hypothetical protein
VVIQGLVAARAPIGAPEAKLLTDTIGATAGSHYVGTSEISPFSWSDAVVAVKRIYAIVAPLIDDVLPPWRASYVLHEHYPEDQRPSSDCASVENLLARDKHALTHLDLALAVPLYAAIASFAT